MTSTRWVRLLMVGFPGLLLASPVQAAQAEPATAGEAEPAAEEPTPPADPRPLTLPYQPGQPIPPGYEVSRRPILGSLIAGGSILGVSYATSVLFGMYYVEASPTVESYSQVPYNPQWLYVPVLGPWIALATTKSHDCRNSHYKSSYYYGQCESANDGVANWQAFLILDGFTQTVGAALIILGSTLRSYRLVLTDDIQAQLLPVPMGRAGEGLALVGTFGGL